MGSAVKEIDRRSRKRGGHQANGNGQPDGLQPPMAFVAWESLGMHIEKLVLRGDAMGPPLPQQQHGTRGNQGQR